MEKKYTYSDWLNGKVVLAYYRDIHLIPKDKQVTWDNFEQKDIELIKKNQKETFEYLKSEHSDIFLKEHIELFKRTRSSRDLKNILKRRISEVFNDKMIYTNDGTYHTSDMKITFEAHYYDQVRNYIDNIFIGGNQMDYSYLPCPNLIDKNNVQPEIVVESLGALWRVLKTRSSSQFKGEGSEKPIDKPDEKNGIDDKVNRMSESLKKANAKIFENDLAVNIFLEAKAKIVNKGRTSEIAKYSAIYNILIKEKCICSFVSHKHFIDYLIRYYKVDLPKTTKNFPYQKDLMQLLKDKMWDKNAIK